MPTSRAPSRASGRSHAHHQDHHRRRDRLDGDLLAIMEALYQEVTAKRELERSFEDMVKEIQHLIEQMDDGERRTYLAESLFLNTVKYENDKLEAYMQKLTKK